MKKYIVSIFIAVVMIGVAEAQEVSFNSPGYPCLSCSSGVGFFGSGIDFDSNGTIVDGYRGLVLAPTAGGSYGRNLLVVTADANKSANHGLDVAVNPTLYIFSVNSPTDQWVSLTHDQTNGVIDVGTGMLDVDATLQADAYNSSDGSAGVTQDCAAGSNITVKNGLVTSCTAP